MGMAMLGFHPSLRLLLNVAARKNRLMHDSLACVLGQHKIVGLARADDPVFLGKAFQIERPRLRLPALGPGENAK
jgi:hypothetical protein